MTAKNMKGMDFERAARMGKIREMAAFMSQWVTGPGRARRADALAAAGGIAARRGGSGARDRVAGLVVPLVPPVVLVEPASQLVPIRCRCVSG